MRPCLKPAVLLACVFLPALLARAEDPKEKPKSKEEENVDPISRLEWTRDPLVLQALSVRSVEERRRAARALGRIAAPGDEVASVVSARVAAALARALEDENDKGVRKEILHAIGQAGTVFGVRALLKARDDKEAPADERATAATALRFAATEEDRAALVAGLSDETPGIARDSALALGILERNLRRAGNMNVDAATRAALLERLGEDALWKQAPEVTYAVVFAASALSDPGADMRAALSRAFDTFLLPDIRAAAARGLAGSARGPVADGPAPQVLFQEAREAAVAVEVVHALSKHKKDRKARAKLVEILSHHPTYHGRAEAASALADKPPEGDGKDEIAALEAALKDSWQTVRGAALASLAQRSPGDALARIAPFLKEGVASQQNAAGALAKLVDSTVPVTEKTTTGAAAQAALEQLVSDSKKDHRVRMSALDALGSAKNRDKAVKLALELLEEEEDVGVFETAVDVVLKDAGSDAETAIKRAYLRVFKNHAFAEAREGIVTGLAELGKALGKVGRDTIEGALKDPEDSVVTAAQRALAKLDGRPPGQEEKTERALPAVLPKDLKGKKPVLAFETSRGDFEVELYPEDAPIHVASVIALAEKKFYDGLTWHRVVPDFVVQGGCPRGDGTGDAGYHIPDEISPRPYERGTLGMPKTAIKDTGGCQLFFTHGRTPHLDGRYTVFGKIRKGVATIDLLEVGDRIVKVRVIYE